VKAWVVPLLIVSAALGCHEDTARVELVKNGKEILAIKPTLVMPKETAEKIMWFYFLHNISGCGFPSEPVDEGEYWTSIPRVGYAGQADKDPIRLHKRSGRISWGQGPSFDSLKAMVKAAKP
jgi:hypothetical protein